MTFLNPFNYGISYVPKATVDYEDFENYYPFMAVPHKQSFAIVPGDPNNIYSPIEPQVVHTGPQFSPLIPSQNIASNPEQLGGKYPAAVKFPPFSVGVMPTSVQTRSNPATSYRAYNPIGKIIIDNGSGKLKDKKSSRIKTNKNLMLQK